MALLAEKACQGKHSGLFVQTKHERDCQLRANDQDKMRGNGTITEINENKICQKISLNTVHERQTRMDYRQNINLAHAWSRGLVTKKKENSSYNIDAWMRLKTHLLPQSRSRGC